MVVFVGRLKRFNSSGVSDVSLEVWCKIESINNWLQHLWFGKCVSTSVYVCNLYLSLSVVSSSPLSSNKDILLDICRGTFILSSNLFPTLSSKAWLPSFTGDSIFASTICAICKALIILTPFCHLTWSPFFCFDEKIIVVLCFC